ncbi:MAG: TetR/AcrR family transcriptional regulator, partial [Cytophagales bacterium]|nr:TetR/AcrR family transcriptional regulator [Cytophagales bacterium]
MSVLLVFVYICNVKHTGIRQRIIETASLLFYRNGYNSTGINEIISESGIAKATLYSHFKSKEDICLSYLQFKNTIFLEDIKVFCTSKPKGKPQLIAIFD